MEGKSKKTVKAWILKGKNGISLYLRRPSARFQYMFENAVPVEITFLNKKANK